MEDDDINRGWICKRVKAFSIACTWQSTTDTSTSLKFGLFTLLTLYMVAIYLLSVHGKKLLRVLV